MTNTSNIAFSHRSKEGTDIGTEKRKKFRQRDWGLNPGPLVMRTSALTAELSRCNRHCTEESTPRRLPMSAFNCWVTAMLQSTANSGRHHELLYGIRTYNKLIILRRLILTVTNTSNKPFSFHPSKESADIETKKRKKFRQSDWGSDPEPLVMRTSALTAEL